MAISWDNFIDLKATLWQFPEFSDLETDHHQN
jgi:hypothetical protein